MALEDERRDPTHSNFATRLARSNSEGSRLPTQLQMPEGRGPRRRAGKGSRSSSGRLLVPFGDLRNRRLLRQVLRLGAARLSRRGLIGSGTCLERGDALLRRCDRFLRNCGLLPFQVPRGSELLFSRLLQNVTNALRSGGDGNKLWHVQNTLDCLRARNRVDHVVGVGGEHRIDNVISKSQLVAQVELQALAEECANGILVIEVALELLFGGRAFVGPLGQSQQRQ